ncbi:hypothetical protein [Taibaiella chishuiensis]|uniref:Uncharacterized protein n=1 Tax=Taibaiella chishuiensis TaxID=1434707 RepID=A0A2P8D1L6_9BACT|nr:hypothetical protein [Taibaiella chishuiensis]PSK91108.1 hypothetical protein B0I18_106119 [Taibaiella chishuiensis]
MKNYTWILLIVLLGSSCGDKQQPVHEQAGKPLYLTDSLASQVNTPIPDSNRKQADSGQ